MAVTAQDRVHHFRSFLRSPRNVGSVIPSSSHLASAMVRPIDFPKARVIVELGAGNGVFTERIAQSRAPDARVLVFERDGVMRRRLQDAYAGFEFHPDALQLAEIVSDVDAIVCSLPLANFARATRERLARDIHAVLRPGASFVAVQYSTQMRRSLQALFGQVSLSFVPLNFPPAFVYTCRKRA